MLQEIFKLLCCMLIVESITEVIIKSVIFTKVRNLFIKRSVFFEYLLTCGYCFSFWTSLFILILLICYNQEPHILNGVLNYFFIFFIIQRGSNMVHGAIDRYFDTRKDIRYNKEEN